MGEDLLWEMICIKCSLLLMVAILIFSSAINQPADAACPVGGCGAGDDSWLTSAQSFISSDVPLVGASASANAGSDFAYSRSFRAGPQVKSITNNSTVSTIPALAEAYVTPGSREELFVSPQMLKSLDSLSRDEAALDVSAGRSPGQSRIRGAVNIPARNFFHENGTLRNISDLAELLGRAGISGSDSVMVYSESFKSGEATAVLYALRCLGHDGARALDGGLDNWMAASLPLESRETVRSPTSYLPGRPLESPADYDLVRSGQVQMVDARRIQEFGREKIGNATWISPESLLVEGRLKSNLNDTFARLNTSQTTVVYSDDIFGASLVWFALELMGYDARIYRWQDWQEHEDRSS
jgi:thiosulfate/3-mercaptopyruvate sulfurtransferase